MNELHASKAIQLDPSSLGSNHSSVNPERRSKGRPRRAAGLVGAFSSLLMAIGCGSSNGSSGDNGGTDSAAVCIFPSAVYSGYDGTGKYQAPIIGTHAKTKITWTLADPSLADLEPNSDGTELMITTKKAGKTTITAKAGDASVSVPFQIYSYTAQNRMDGEHRYKNMEGSDPACFTCHETGPDHSPTQVDADTDDQVQHSFLTGTDPEGRPIEAPKHTWTVTDAEKPGLVSYLRSLPPKGFPEVDPEQPEACNK